MDEWADPNIQSPNKLEPEEDLGRCARQLREQSRQLKAHSRSLREYIAEWSRNVQV